jgi:hypothetical protein
VRGAQHPTTAGASRSWFSWPASFCHHAGPTTAADGNFYFCWVLSGAAARRYMLQYECLLDAASTALLPSTDSRLDSYRLTLAMMKQRRVDLESAVEFEADRVEMPSRETRIAQLASFTPKSKAATRSLSTPSLLSKKRRSSTD